MKRVILICHIVCLQILQFAPMVAAANPSVTLVFTALQTASARSASDEFIQLTNLSDQSISLGDYQVQYFSTSAVDFNKPARTITLIGTLLPQASYTLASSTASISQASPSYSAVLATAGGHLRIVSAQKEVDRLGWGTASQPLGAAAAAPSPGQTLSRVRDATQAYALSGDNSRDFTIDPLVVGEGTAAGVVISEILPDPAAPVTDSQGEFVELHNPTATVQNMAGHKIMAGSSLSKAFSLPVENIEPGAYKVFYSNQTKLQLSNTAGKVVFTNQSGTVLSEVGYSLPKAGQSFAYDGAAWVWTTTPTPGEANVFSDAQNDSVAKSGGSATKKPATKKVAPKTTKKSSKSSTASGVKQKAASVNSDSAKPPVHTGVVAGVGGAAVLYGAYEYRQDAANFIRKFGRHRKNR